MHPVAYSVDVDSRFTVLFVLQLRMSLTVLSMMFDAQLHSDLILFFVLIKPVYRLSSFHLLLGLVVTCMLSASSGE